MFMKNFKYNLQQSWLCLINLNVCHENSLKAKFLWIGSEY